MANLPHPAQAPCVSFKLFFNALQKKGILLQVPPGHPVLEVLLPAIVQEDGENSNNNNNNNNQRSVQRDPLQKDRRNSNCNIRHEVDEAAPGLTWQITRLRRGQRLTFTLAEHQLYMRKIWKMKMILTMIRLYRRWNCINRIPSPASPLPS
jgi:hypothetical protein